MKREKRRVRIYSPSYEKFMRKKSSVLAYYLRQSMQYRGMSVNAHCALWIVIHFFWSIFWDVWEFWILNFDFFSLCFFCHLSLLYRAIQPQCLGSLVMYFSQTKENAAIAAATDDPRIVYLYAIGIIMCSILTISFSHPFMVYALQMGMRVRITCCSLIYRKVSSRCIYSRI